MYATTTAAIQEHVSALLHQGAVDLFIGYKQGSNPLRITPHTVRHAEEVETLVWSVSCINNLVTMLKKFPGQKVGILVKGCDSRSLVELLKLHQVRRENLHIVGVPCNGIIDLKKVAEKRPPANIKSVAEKDDRIILFEKSGEMLACSREELLHDKCQTCATPNPVIYDELIGHEVAVSPQAAQGSFASVDTLEQLEVQDRFAFWTEQLSKCTLCYACQTVCPMCFCKECTATLPRNDPRWKSRQREDVFAFHMIRAYHMTGRCTGCLECERVCPVHIPLSAIFKKVEKDTRELFAYTAGMDTDDVIPLSSFAETDQVLS
jgi:ferredoxin